SLMKNGNAKHYVIQAFKYLKAIGLQGKAFKLYDALPLPKPEIQILVPVGSIIIGPLFLSQPLIFSRNYRDSFIYSTD
ncbi:TPA: hypothetical protein IBX06_004614, partial [Escherichia coli]|nr:hypothetical protein [Escherichia coli]